MPPGREVISAVSLEGLPEDSDGDSVLDGLATRASDRFLGLWDGVVFEYQLYDPELLRQDLERVRRSLRSDGYYQAQVTAASVISEKGGRVRVRIRVVPGPAMRIGRIQINGLEKLPILLGEKVLLAAPLSSGAILKEANYETAKRQVVRVLRDAGFAFASLEGSTTVDLVENVAHVSLVLKPGPRATLGNVTVVGLETIPRDRILSALDLKKGDEFSQAELDDARRALATLGVFSTVKVEAALEGATGNSVPIAVTVEETKLRSVKIAGGGKLDTLQFANRLSLSWEHRNLFGGLRHFRGQVSPSLIYYPTSLSRSAPPDRALFANALRAELEQPGLFEGRTTGTLSADYNVNPLLLPGADPNAGILGFTELKTAVGLRRALVNHRILLAPAFNWQLKVPFDYRTLTLGKKTSANDELLSNLIIAYPEIAGHLDLRDNPLDPRQGVFTSINLQTARPWFGGSVTDYRIRPELRIYLPVASRVTLATRFTVGLLFPQDYGDTFSGTQVSEEAQVADQHKLLFRGFFSGGSNSNRGYPQFGVGPQGSVAFLTDPNRAVPLGGTSLWEASLEIRYRLTEPFRLVLFADTSDISRTQALSFLAPHLSVGAGVRYMSPVGAIRFDAGYRVPGLQDLESSETPGALTRVLGQPMALHLALGEAF